MVYVEYNVYSSSLFNPESDFIIFLHKTLVVHTRVTVAKIRAHVPIAVF